MVSLSLYKKFSHLLDNLYTDLKPVENGWTLEDGDLLPVKHLNLIPENFLKLVAVPRVVVKQNDVHVLKNNKNVVNSVNVFNVKTESKIKNYNVSILCRFLCRILCLKIVLILFLPYR